MCVVVCERDVEKELVSSIMREYARGVEAVFIDLHRSRNLFPDAVCKYLCFPPFAGHKKTQNPGHVDCQNFSAPITAAQEAQLNLSTTPSPHRWHLFPKFDKMAMAYLKQFNFKFIDMSPLYLRPDSHPGHLKDCLHICMPGPIDLFSTLFMQMLFNGEV